MNLVAFMTFLVINFVQVFINSISFFGFFFPGLHKETVSVGTLAVKHHKEL